MARDPSSSIKSSPTEQDHPLAKDPCRPTKSFKTGSSNTSRMSSRSAFDSSTNSKRSSTSQNLSPEPTTATSWSSHGHFPRNPPMNEHPRIDDHQMQFTLGNDGITYTQDADPYMPHIGAQFYEVVGGGTQMVMGPLEWNADHRYQTQVQPVTNDMGPMERYQQQDIQDEPYGNMLFGVLR